MTSCREVFSQTGALSRVLEGYAPREEQLVLAEAVEQALQKQQVLIGEAGTGVGKSLAYLVPAVLSDQHIIISTGTKHLQDQLFFKDVPLVKKALGMDMPVAMLKGRNNYLCLHRMKTARSHGMVRHAEYAGQLAMIERWSIHTRSGEISELGEIAEDSYIWPLVTSTTDNCLGQECPDWDECFVLQARKKAQQAQIVIVNHHLFLADLALKEEGFGEVLPHAQAYIMDEAHQLPDIASNFFSLRISSRQISELCKDTMAEYLADAADMVEIRYACDDISAALPDIREQLGAQNNKRSWSQIVHKPALKSELSRLLEKLHLLHQQLDIAADRSQGLQNCRARCEHILQFIQSYCERQFEQERILWFETWDKGFAFNATPYETGSYFQKILEQQKAAWVFTSATLSIQGSLQTYKQHMGIVADRELLVDSPFDYKNHSRLLIPVHLPEPNHGEYLPQLFTICKKLAQSAHGKTCCLFTSYNALQTMVKYFEQESDFELFVQGRGAKMQLIEGFRKSFKGVLLATSSFWEGVDIRGQQLSCVVIDRLPFAHRDDPVLKARRDFIQSQGKDPFMSYLVPKAVIKLKQGAGRLIRDVHDKGLLVLGDNRLLNKPYGEAFIQSLNNMPLLQTVDEAQAFLASITAETTENFQETI